MITEEQRRYSLQPFEQSWCINLRSWVLSTLLKNKGLESRLCLCSITHVVANLCLVRAERWADVVDGSDPIE